MSFIIGNKCIGCVDGSCLKVCPIDCIHGPIYIDNMGRELESVRNEGGVEGLQLYIDPKECINCGACVPECPVDAIYSTEKEAIALGDEKSVHDNYEFFGMSYTKK
jgi:NAD-dependent dihydropyrimidine dehydrogenase PreA subunit